MEIRSGVGIACGGWVVVIMGRLGGAAIQTLRRWRVVVIVWWWWWWWWWWWTAFRVIHGKVWVRGAHKTSWVIHGIMRVGVGAATTRVIDGRRVRRVNS